MPLLITFNADQQRAVKIAQSIEGLGNWGVLTPTSFLLAADLTPGQLMEKLQPLLGPKDHLWVVSAALPWAGYGDPIVDDLAEALIGPSDDWVPKDWDEATQSRS